MLRSLKMLTGIILLLAGTSLSELADSEFVYSITTDIQDIKILDDKALLDAGEIISEPGAPLLGFKTVRVVLPPDTRLEGISVDLGQPVEITSGLQLDFATGDIKTGFASTRTAPSPDPAIYGSDKAYPVQPVEIIGSGYWSSIHLADLAVYPLAFKPLSGKVLFYPEITVHFNLSNRESGAPPFATDQLAYNEVLKSAINKSDLAKFALAPAQSREAPAGILPDPEYLLVTSRDIAPGFKSFISWKNEKGVSAQAAYIEDILSSSPGSDPPERLRNYLITAHTIGIRWVLLGGDEDVIPIRYLYAGNIGQSLPPLDILQVGDIYYSDMTGDWDRDGDNVWGETSQDRPDIYPEIYVGRVSVRTAEEARAWSDKAVTYEKNPGRGDYSYLTRALILAADEMRDLNQHLTLAQMMPGNFAIDNHRLAEEPSGSSDSPTQPTGIDVINVMREGWGFIANHNHGDVSYYASRSSGYNQYGRSNVWGDTVWLEFDDAFSHIPDSGRYGVHYSTSCDVGAIDFDKGIFHPGPYYSTYSLAESFLKEPGGGVAFLGCSRWGWVSASFRMEGRFVERVLVDSTSRLGVAEAFSKVDYSGYHDIVYGHNLYGDPEMALWKYVNGRLNVEIVASSRYGGSQFLTFRITENGRPVEGANACLYLPGEIQEIGQSDAEGYVYFEIEERNGSKVTLTASMPGYIPAQSQVVLDNANAFRIESDLPRLVSLAQNYPNPFNATTLIQFELPQAASVNIDVYDIGGRLVKGLAEGEFQAGAHQVVWDGRSDSGERVASGMYFYRFVSGNMVTVKQMTLLK